jgi:hypothetical protein
MPAQTIANTLGAMELATVIGVLLIGINTLQVFSYFRRYYKEDTWLMKITVGVVWVLQILHSAFLTHMLYYYTIIKIREPKAIAFSVFSFNMAIFCAAIQSFTVQCFFIWRVKVIAGGKILPYLCFVVAFVCLGFSCSNGVGAFMIKSFATFSVRWKIPTSTSLATRAFTDTAIAVALSSSLWRSRSGMANMDQIVDRIIAYALGCGLVTSTLAILELICFLTMDNLIWLSVFIITTKLYANSLLATLNARDSLRSDLRKTRTGGTQSERIHVHTTVNTMTDTPVGPFSQAIHASHMNDPLELSLYRKEAAARAV